MNKLNAVALANTAAIIDLILHPLFHIWVYFSPESYEWAMNIFVAGLQLNVTGFDSNILHIVVGTIIEAGVFWLLSYTVASVYNKFNEYGSKQN